MTKPFSPSSRRTKKTVVASELPDSALASICKDATPSELTERFLSIPIPLQKRLLQMADSLLLVPDDVQESFVGFIQVAVRKMQVK